MLDDNFLVTISPESLTSYLSKAGWTNESPNSDVFKYTHKEGGTLILPTSPQAHRYAISVNNVIKTISAWENRSPIDVFQNIVNPRSDSLILAFCGELAKKGSLPLSYFYESIRNIRNSILYSACGEWQPKPFYKKPSKIASDIAEQARFGQTQIGSFVISVSLSHSTAPNNADEPIERKVIKRILTGIKQARDYVTSGKLIDVANDFKSGLNANIAESLAALKTEGISLGISAQWDSHLCISEEFKKPLKIEERTFEMLEIISKEYRGKETSQPISITKSKVISLKWDFENPDIDEDFTEHFVILKIIEPDNISVSNIYVTLEPKDYMEACKAHMSSKHIKIEGELQKYKNHWWLFNYKNFQVTN